MDKLQTVRSMVYAAVAATVTFSVPKENLIFYALIPLAVTFQTYDCAVVSWKGGGRRASAYLAVSHESSAYKARNVVEK